jgi:hypothetical protein
MPEHFLLDETYRTDGWDVPVPNGSYGNPPGIAAKPRGLSKIENRCCVLSAACAAKEQD